MAEITMFEIDKIHTMGLSLLWGYYV